VKYEWSNKGHFWNEKARDFDTKFAYCEKRQWKLKYFQSSNISSFRSLPFINTCLIFSWQKLGKKIERVAWSHCFRRSVFSYRIILQSHVMFSLHLTAVNKSQGQRIMILQVVLALFKRNHRLWPVNFENSELWNYKEEFCALHASANRLWKCLLSEAFCGLVKRMRTPVLFVTNRPFKRQKYFILDKRIVYQNFCSAPLTFRTLSFLEIGTRRQVACEMLIVCCSPIRSDSSPKNYLHLYLRKIVHLNGEIAIFLLESFYHAPLTFS